MSGKVTKGSYEQARTDLVEFEETKPISTYVFAFAAGDFEEFVRMECESFDEEIRKQG